MRRLVVLSTAVLLILSGDLYSRRSGSSSFRSSSSSRSSYRSSSRSTSRQAAPATTRTKTQSMTKTKTTTTQKPKAVATTKTSRALQKKNAVAAKKYGSRANAQKAFQEKIKSDPSTLKAYPNKFDKEPSVRPAYIPSSVTRGGVSYNVTYMDGGYGYYHMVNGMRTWMLLDMATDIMITDAMLRSHGYGTYTATGAPIVRAPVSSGVIIMSVVGGVLAIGILAVVLAKMGG